MKKISLVIAALAAVFAVSCNKEIATPQTPDTSAPAGMKLVTITASVEGADTKTSYDAGGKFSWTKGDQISVMGTGYGFYTLTATSDGPTTTFTGYIPEGVTLRQEAFYPADPGTNRTDGSYYFNIPQYKDLSASGSADLPMGAYSGTDSYVFKHITGAALLTFTNFPDEVKTAEISIVNARLKLTGVFNAYLSSGLWTWNSKADVAEEERTLIRKVPVTNGQAQLYMPYNGSLWWDYTSTINIKGFDDQGNEYVLLKDKTMKPDEASAVRGVVKKYAPLALPDYVPEADLTKVDWSAENVATVTNDPASEDAILEELKVVADDNYMYVRIKGAAQTPYGGNYIDIYLSDGDAEAEGAAKAWDQWPGTLGVDLYKKEHKGTIDADGNITSMTFNHNGKYENVEFKNEIVDGKITWYMIFPVDYMEMYKSSTSTVYVGFRLWKDWGNFAAIPARGWGQSMLEVTLP